MEKKQIQSLNEPFINSGETTQVSPSHRLIEFIKECEIKAGLDLGEHLPKLEQLTDGLSNNNYLLKTQQGSYLIRENTFHSTSLCDRGNEVECWQLAARANLAPKLLWFSSDKSYYLSEFVPQPQNKLLTPENILSLLGGLKSLPKPKLERTSHEQWIIYQKKLQLLFSDIEQLISKVSRFQVEFEKWKLLFQLIENKQRKIKAWTSDITAAILELQYTHRDLNSENLIIKDNKLICIDFEYSCAAEPLFDLASVIESNTLSELDKQTIAQRYLSKHRGVTVDAIKALPAMRKIHWCFFYYWAAFMAGFTLKQMLENNTPSLLADFDLFMGYPMEYEGKF